MLSRLNMILPSAYLSSLSPRQACYHLKTRDAGSMQQALELFDCEVRDKKVDSYDILGTTIEEIFLDLMRKHDRPPTEGEKAEMSTAIWTSAHPTRISDLPNGRTVPSIKQAFTIFYKRLLVFRRSWRALFLATLIAACGSCIPLVFLRNIDTKTCVATYSTPTTTPLDLQSTSMLSPSLTSVFSSPPGIQPLGSSTNALRVVDLPDNATFVSAINENYRGLTLGGISINSTTGSSLIAWEASPPGFTGASMLNLATNVLYNRALNMTGQSAFGPKSIRASHSVFPFISSARFAYLRWLVFFGLVMVRFMTLFSGIFSTHFIHRLYIQLSSLCMCRRSVAHLSKPCSSRMG